MTIVLDGLDSPHKSDLGHSWPEVSLLVTSGGHPWRPVQTCSLENPRAPLVLTSGG